jgi:cell division septation protein DedD
LSETQEPSYYEIALTNRQVLVAFVVLLACVLAAFFAGVWVGKGSPAAASAEVDSPAMEPTPIEGTPEELTFFGEGETSPPQGRPDLPELAENPNPDTTLAADLGLEPPPTPTPRATTPPAATAPPVAAATSAAAVAPPAAANRDDPAPLRPGEMVIQVFSSRDEVQARRLTTRLRSAGFRAFLSPSGEMFRVRIGPYTDRAQAQADADRAKHDFRVDTWITSNP